VSAFSSAFARDLSFLSISRRSHSRTQENKIELSIYK
jgi:hypothetical protein